MREYHPFEGTLLKLSCRHRPQVRAENEEHDWVYDAGKYKFFSPRQFNKFKEIRTTINKRKKLWWETKDYRNCNIKGFWSGDLMICFSLVQVKFLMIIHTAYSLCLSI